MLLSFANALACEPAEPPPDPPALPAPIDSDGYDDAPATGPVFLADRIAFSEPGHGLDIDGDGELDGQINQAWQPIIPVINQRFSASVNSGRILISVEIAGLIDPYDGDDPAVTLKLYECDDADSQPTNNFCRDPGCARVAPDPDQFEDGQTRYRAPPAPIVAKRYRGFIDASFGFDIEANEDLRVAQLHIELTLPTDLWELPNTVVCGVSSAYDLHQVILPLCEYQPVFCEMTGVPEDLTIAEYLVLLHHDPDSDIDGDGLERFELDDGAQVAVCYDGDGFAIEGPDCLSDPRLVDGYSVCFDMHAIPGELVF